MPIRKSLELDKLTESAASKLMKTMAASRTVDSEPRPEIGSAGAKLRGRFQIGLRDVAVWVVGAAVISYLSRSWVVRWPGFADPYLSYLYPFLSMGVMISAISLAWHLTRQLIGLARGSIDLGISPLERTPHARVGAILWRLLVATAALVMVAEVLSGLNPPRSLLYTNYSAVPRNRDWDTILPVFGLVMIAGLLAGIKPAAARMRRPAGSAWFSTVVAGAFGIGCLVGTMVYVHLVLVAIEAVSNAQRPAATKAFDRGAVQTTLALDAMPNMQAPLVRRVSLISRINDAGIPAGLALVSVVATSVWIGRDLRQEASDVAGKTLSFWSVLYRIATLAATVAAATYLIATTIPRIHVSLSDGIWRLLGPRQVLLVFVAVASLSAGVVARAIGRRTESVDPEPQSPFRIRRRLGWAAVCLVLVAVILVAFARIWRAMGYPWINVPSDLIANAVAAVMSNWDALWDPALPLAFWVPALAWAFWETLRLCGPWALDRLTAFDAVALSWSSAGRFVCYCSALTVLCLCALPTFFVAGLVVYHIRLMGLG
jgi:hypothetical protein